MIINTHYTLFSLIVFFIGLVNCFSAPNISLKLEIERSLDRGTSWLLENQDMKDGNWGSPDYPALTALALRTILGHQSIKEEIKHNRQVEKGFSFLRRKVQSDGGIYGKGLASYNTSISLLAFLQYKKPEDEKIIEDARSFLINQQSDFDRKGEPDNIFDGGVGYGSTWAHSDMSNTHLAMEALYYAKKTIKSKEGGMLDLDWDSAIQFVSRCQNLPESNDQAWVSSYSDDRGGFVYFPGNSMAGERLDSRGRTSLRSYGSMSYAGLLSFIYAEMSPSDIRLVEVRKWLSQNYTIEENPGMGMQGLYYYYHTMAKALSLSGVDEVLDGDGNPVDWREELSIRLFDQQKENGFWINQSGRWWEKDPILVSCYAMLALERIYHAL